MAAMDASLVDGRLFSPQLLAAVRQRFHHVESDPFNGPRAYLENAGGGLTLRSVFDADLRINSLPDNAGRENAASREISRVISAGREDVATFCNAKSGTILSEQSTTGCAFRILSTAVAGIPGTNLVCSELDHASFYDAAGFLAHRHGLERRVIPLERKTGALEIKDIVDRVDSGTVAVSLIHASNITGGRVDIKTAVAEIRKRAPQAIVVADGAQHAQHGLVDVANLDVDAYVFSAYKVFCKPGFAFAYLSPRLAALPHWQLAGKPATDWDLGTRDPGGFAGFSCVIDYLCWLGAHFTPPGGDNSRRALIASAYAAIEAHEAALSERLIRGAGGVAGLRAHSQVTIHGQPHPFHGREAVFAFSVAGMATSRLVAEFGRRGIILHDRISDAYSKHTLSALGTQEVVRVSLAHYNTPAEVDAFLRALSALTREIGTGKEISHELDHRN